MWGVEVNPITLEWVEHYVRGSQTPKTLPTALIGYTKRHLCVCLNNLRSSTLEGVARCYDEEGYKSTDWYRHPTAGVVGGFAYKLISWEDKFVFHCWDTWDFNPETSDGEDYLIPVPKTVDVEVLTKILKRFRVPIRKRSGNRVGISETWLSQFNHKHKFVTNWEVIVEDAMSSPVNYGILQD
jgi:hypothetical protein